MRREFVLVTILFIILALAISFVYGSQIMGSLSKKSSSKIELKQSKNIIPKDFYPMQVYDYIDNSINSQFKVQIINFDTEDKLDSFIEYKIKKGSKIEKEGNIIFLDQYKNYIFWKSNNTQFIQIIAEREDFNPKSEGSGIFPEELIQEYLSLYPDDCSNDECLNQDKKLDQKIKDDLKWFNNPPKEVKDSTDYTGDDSCPINETEWKKVEESPALNSEELKELKKYCDSKAEYKDKNQVPISKEIKECGKDINEYLKQNEFNDYDPEEILNECLLREQFLIEHKDYSQNMLNLFFDERNKLFLRNLKDIEELKKEMNLSRNKRIIYPNGTIVENYSKDKAIKHPWFER